jgi:hypothetical protein
MMHIHPVRHLRAKSIAGSAGDSVFEDAAAVRARVELAAGGSTASVGIATVTVAGADREGILRGEFDELVVVAGHADEPRPRRSREADPIPRN